MVCVILYLFPILSSPRHHSYASYIAPNHVWKVYVWNPVYHDSRYYAAGVPCIIFLHDPPSDDDLFVVPKKKRKLLHS